VSFLLQTGQRFNLLEGCAAAIVASPVAATGYEVAYLSDRTPIPFCCSALTSPLTLTQDLNAILGGDMESVGLPSWTAVVTGTGAVTRTTVAGEFYPSAGSTAGMKLAAGTGTAKDYKDITVRAGQKRRFTGALKGDAANATKIRVTNRQTGKDLKSDGTWAAGPQYVHSQTAAAWSVLAYLPYTVESWAVCLADAVTLRIEVSQEVPTGVGYADDIYDHPDVDGLCVWGHSIEPSCVVEWRSSTDGFSGSDVLVATMTQRHPAFYALATHTTRWLRLKITGVPTAAISIGELVAFQSFALSRSAKLGLSVERAHPQGRAQTPDGMTYSTPYSGQGSSVVAAEFVSEAAGDLAQHQEILARGRGGHWPALMIPLSAESEAYWGKLETVLTWTREVAPYADGATQTLTEFPAAVP
jgi:hypothetical protein